MSSLVGPSNLQSPSHRPHSRPGLHQHGKSLDRVNAAEEESGSRPNAILVLQFGSHLVYATLRYVHAVWDRCDPNAKIEVAQIFGFYLASRDVTLSLSQI